MGLRMGPCPSASTAAQMRLPISLAMRLADKKEGFQVLTYLHLVERPNVPSTWPLLPLLPRRVRITVTGESLGVCGSL